MSCKTSGVFSEDAATEAAVAAYMRECHPAGYGTGVASGEEMPTGRINICLWWSRGCKQALSIRTLTRCSGSRHVHCGQWRCSDGQTTNN